MPRAAGRAAASRLSLSMIGDKIMHSKRGLRAGRRRMTTAVKSSPGVEWAGGLSRDDAMAYSKTADIWGSAGGRRSSTPPMSCPPRCSSTAPWAWPRWSTACAAHVELLGEDYPLFVDALHRGRCSTPSNGWPATRTCSRMRAEEAGMEAIDRYRMANTALERIHAALRATEVRPSVTLAVAGRPLFFFWLLVRAGDLAASRGTHTVRLSGQWRRRGPRKFCPVGSDWLTGPRGTPASASCPRPASGRSSRTRPRS